MTGEFSLNIWKNYLHLQECSENLDLMLTKLSYVDHNWTICGDLEVTFMLLGQQSEYAKLPYFCLNEVVAVETTLYKERTIKKNIIAWNQKHLEG